jgi:hypothetical protein
MWVREVGKLDLYPRHKGWLLTLNSTGLFLNLFTSSSDAGKWQIDYLNWLLVQKMNVGKDNQIVGIGNDLVQGYRLRLMARMDYSEQWSKNRLNLEESNCLIKTKQRESSI